MKLFGFEIKKIEKIKKEDKIPGQDGPEKYEEKIHYFKTYHTLAYRALGREIFCFSSKFPKDEFTLETSIKVNNLYNIKSNIIYETNISKIAYSINEITKEEYEELFKNNICDCDLGKGNDIRESKNMYYYPNEIEKEINNKYPDWYIEFEEDRGHTMDFYIYKNNCLNERSGISVEKIYKKACLACGKCIQEFYKIERSFNSRFEYIKSELMQEKMINDICSGE